MNEESVMYRPYRNYAYLFVFFALCGVLALAAAVYSIAAERGEAKSLLFLGIICLILAKIAHDDSKIAVFFEDGGIRISEKRRKKGMYIPWEELTYAYYTRSRRGFPYIVLSPEALYEDEARDYATRSERKSRMCIDSVVVIFITRLQNTAQVKEAIQAKVPNIGIYR